MFWRTRTRFKEQKQNYNKVSSRARIVPSSISNIIIRNTTNTTNKICIQITKNKLISGGRSDMVTSHDGSTR